MIHIIKMLRYFLKNRLILSNNLSFFITSHFIVFFFYLQLFPINFVIYQQQPISYLIRHQHYKRRYWKRYHRIMPAVLQTFCRGEKNKIEVLHFKCISMCGSILVRINWEKIKMRRLKCALRLAHAHQFTIMYK